MILFALLGALGALFASGIIIDEVLGGFAASEAADNEREVQRKNQEAWDAYRRQYLDEFRKSRGSEGNAFMPLYFGTGADSFEKKLADDYKALYSGLPKVNPADYAAANAAYLPMMEASRGALADVYNGNLTNARLGYLEPVNQARTKMARGNQDAIFQALKERINLLNAQNARKGFSGTGSFAQNRLLGSTIGARQTAANTIGAADLANAMDTRAIHDSGADLRLRMDPSKQAANYLSYMAMPTAAATGDFMTRLQPTSAFRIGTAMPNLIAPMPENAIPTDSQIWLQAGANMAKNVSDLATSYFTGGLGGMGGGGGGGGGGMGLTGSDF